MRRNWDMIRDVLLSVELGELQTIDFDPLDEGETDETGLTAHCEMARSAGFVRVDDFDAPTLTHAGRDLLDSIRDDGVWSTCQQAITMNGGGLPTDLVLDLTSHVIRFRYAPLISPKSDLDGDGQPATH